MSRPPTAFRDCDPVRVEGHLFDERARFVLDRLASHRVMTLADLADELVVHERDRRITEIPGTAVSDVYFDLHRSTIPLLRVLGHVVFDQELDLVAITGTGNAFVT